MASNSSSSNENQINLNRREKEENHKDGSTQQPFQIHHHAGPELMDAEDSLMEMRSSSMANKFEKNEIAVEKLTDKVKRLDNLF
jgi:hypothetical protein